MSEQLYIGENHTGIGAITITATDKGICHWLLHHMKQPLRKCHRVIGANGQLVGYGGGLPIKIALLDLEKRAQ